MPSQLELELLNRQAYAPKSADEAIQDSVIDFWNKITTPTMPDVDEDLSQATGGLSGLIADTSPLGLLGIAPIIKGGTGIKGLYSRLNKAVEAMPDKLSVAAAKSWLTQRAGKEEASWRNIEKILGNRNPQDKISKAELATHLEANPLNVKTTRLGEPDPTHFDPRYSAGGPPVHPTKYNQYTLPGGKNYREDLIQLDKNVKLDDRWQITPVTGGFNAFDKDGLQLFGEAFPTEEALYTHLNQFTKELGAGNLLNTFRSSHWDQPNILAHVRHNQRTLPAPERVPKDILSDVDPNEFGSKGRFIEEIQSDWHEQGRERGYKDADRTKRIAELKQIIHDSENPEARKLAFQNLHMLNKSVPDAPFKEDWANLALKQQLMDVVEDPNLEWMGWTPGSVQNDRYDLSNQVSRLAFDQEANGKGSFHAWDKFGNQVVQQDINSPDELVALIGKDAASRLMDHPVTTGGDLSYIPEGGKSFELMGEDLQIGGQGMTDFYDRQLPEKMNKILKGFGGKVEKGPLMVKKGTDMYSTGTEDDNFISMKGGNINVNDEHIASAIPRWTPENFRETNQAGDEVMGLLRERFKNQPQFIQAWIARLSPEMKERIKKEGLPLLMLLLAREMEGQDGSNQAEELR